MIKRLQRKFILITMLSLLVVLIIVVGGINGAYIYQMNRKSDTLLQMLTENGGKFPGNMPKDMKKVSKMPPEYKEKPGFNSLGHMGDFFGYRISEETPFETRYFTVTIQEDILEIDLTHVAAVTEEEVRNFAKQIYEKDREIGYYGQYKYLKSRDDSGKTLLVFVDCGNDLHSARNFACISLFIGLFCLLLVLVLVVLFSRRAMRPVIESMEKQKQFITDAGHEIKTPIAIISANAEVIEMCEGESEWTRSIRNQVKRLNGLISNLLTLSRMDEVQMHTEMKEFSCSDAVQETLESFEPVIRTKEQVMTAEIEADLYMMGNEGQIRQLAALLADNAVKYAPEKGNIKLTLAKKEKYLVLDVYNDCEEIPGGDLNRLFDRFYRADVSRSRETGGYGIGLSVAAAIVKAHKGKIGVKREGNGICFKIKLPVK